MRLDVVIPAHNEEARIDRTLRLYRSMVGGQDVRICVALDHCTDRTAEVVRHHADQDPRVALFDYPKLGKGGVIMETFRRSDADVIGFVDADCSTPPAEFMRLVDVVSNHGADVAIASRHHPSALVPKRRPAGRRLTSAFFQLLVRRLFRLSVSDTQCGAKVLRRRTLDAILPVLSSRDFIFDVDLLVSARRLGFRVAEVPTVWIDQSGSKVQPVTDAVRMAASSVHLWLHHRLVSFPAPPAPGSPAPGDGPAPAGAVIDLREARAGRAGGDEAARGAAAAPGMHRGDR